MKMEKFKLEKDFYQGRETDLMRVISPSGKIVSRIDTTDAEKSGLVEGVWYAVASHESFNYGAKEDQNFKHSTGIMIRSGRGWSEYATSLRV
jgi:hypothetical protein